jgi:hypothetical protein
MAPGRYLPNVGRGDVVVGPAPFGFSDYAFEVPVTGPEGPRNTLS